MQFKNFVIVLPSIQNRNMENSDSNLENQALEIIEKSGLEKSSSELIASQLLPFFEKAKEWRSKALALVVTDVGQKELMNEARVARLALKELRVDAEKTRKRLKEDSLRTGKAIDGLYNLIEFLVKPIENHLKDQEDFEKIQLEKQKQDRLIIRTEQAQALSEYLPADLPLAELSDTAFASILQGAELQKQKAEQDRLQQEEQRQEQIRLQEQERLKKEEEERIAAINIEKERLAQEKRELELKAQLEQERKQREEVEQKAKEELRQQEESQRKEREAQEERIRQQREQLEKEKQAREKAEREAKDRQDEIDRQRRKEQEEKMAKEREDRAREKKLAAAPDKEKMLIFADSLMKLPFPELSTEEYKSVLKDTKGLLQKVCTYIIEKAQ